MVASNVTGTFFVFFVVAFVLPLPGALSDDWGLLFRNAVVVFGYLLLVGPIATTIGIRSGEPIQRWLADEREPTDEERAFTLRYALWSLRIPALGWAGGALLTAAVNVPESAALALAAGVTVALGGVTTVAVAYLLCERVMRQTVARALEGAPLRDYDLPGVATRAVLMWAVATGIPLLGITVVGIARLVGGDVNSSELAGTAAVLGAAGILVGLAATTAVARSVADPLESVRSALARVARGDLSAEVPVTDASEVGFLQAGFNRMVEGLRERERLGDLFGRHVGEDVARQALERGVELGGEEREAAVLFVDIVGSTSFAADRPPNEVVGMLNAFFRIVVEAVRSHGGWVNKFEGDAALCIFGTPLAQDDAAGCALRAAREIQRRLADELPHIEAGIGVSAGRVVAGNVGAEDRFEYTVIGDPVNEAARLTELAKTKPGRLLASEAVVSRARPEETERWRLEDAVTLRGRSEPTRLALPADVAAAATR
jgi:adenylate cyclase